MIKIARLVKEIEAWSSIDLNDEAPNLTALTTLLYKFDVSEFDSADGLQSREDGSNSATENPTTLPDSDSVSAMDAESIESANTNFEDNETSLDSSQNGQILSQDSPIGDAEAGGGLRGTDSNTKNGAL